MFCFQFRRMPYSNAIYVQLTTKECVSLELPCPFTLSNSCRSFFYSTVSTERGTPFQELYLPQEKGPVKCNAGNMDVPFYARIEDDVDHLSNCNQQKIVVFCQSYDDWMWNLAHPPHATPVDQITDNYISSFQLMAFLWDKLMLILADRAVQKVLYNSLSHLSVSQMVLHTEVACYVYRIL